MKIPKWIVYGYTQSVELTIKYTAYIFYFYLQIPQGEMNSAWSVDTAKARNWRWPSLYKLY